MSCQQVSRFITTTPSIINTNTTVPKTAVAAAAAASLTLTAPIITSIPTTAATTIATTPTAGAEVAALVSIKATTAIAVSTALSTTTSSIASLTAATAEDQDPYVFTESVHATPPVHFNAQKSRIRHADTAAITQPPQPTTTAAAATTATTTTTTIEIETDTIPVATATTNVDNSATSKITPTATTNTPAAPAPASAATVEVTTTTTAATTAVTNCNAVSTVTTTSTSTVIAVTSTSPVKNGTQQQKQQRKRQSHSKSPLLLTTSPLSPTLAVRVQEQQLQQQQHTKILSPTCGLQLTPSLWQTPLLLDTNTSNINNNNNNNNNNNGSSSNTIPTTNYNNNINVNKNNNNSNNNNNITSINGNNFTNVSTVNGTHVTINSPMHSPTAVTAALMANITHSAIPLPPSNFHHTTLAQHLQKVECIKKPPKRQNLNPMCIATHKAIMTPPATPPIITTATSPVLLPPLQPLHTSIEQIQQQQEKLALNKENIQFSTGEDKQQQQQQQQPSQQLKQKLPDEHSDTDLNEIPVNVIFRKPQTATATTPVINKTTTKNTATLTTQATIEKQKPQQTFEQPKLVTIITSPIKQQQQQQLSKPTLIMPCTKVDIDAAVSTLQSMQFNALQEENACNVQQLQQQQVKETDNVQHVTTENKNTKTISNQTPANKQKLDLTKTTTTTTTTSNTNNNNSNNKRSRGKQTVILPALNQNSLAADHGSAVAVVKMSSTELSADISDLANATVLPYVVQKHWLTAEYPQKQLISREERIAQNKNLLRRQALQLLNTHSLQKLPLQAARKRLICVDRLLRKYSTEQLHTDRFYHSNKLCHTAGCQNRALEMTSHCWQHITQNSTQQIFQTCAALDEKNIQCVTPVFDILHEVPLCELHEKQRELYELKLKNNNNNNNNLVNNNNKVKVNATNNCANVAKQKQCKHTSGLLQIQQQQQQQQQQPKQIILQQQMPQLQKLHMNNKININNNNNNNNNNINNNVINNNNKNVINIKPVKAQTTAIATTTTTTRKRKTQLVNEVVARAPKRVKKCVATPPLVATTTTTKIATISNTQQQQQQQQLPRLNVNATSTNLTKAMIANTSIMLSSVAPAPSPPPPLLQRKSSTTSLESIGSTSYNSASPPQHCYSYYSELQQQQQHQQQQQQQTQQTQNQLNYVNTVPALAPLSFGFSNPFVNSTTATNATNNNSSHNGNSNSIQTANINTNNNNNNNNHHIGSSIMFNANLNATISAADLKEHEINQIVSQFTMLHNNQTLNSNGHNIIGTNGHSNNNNNNNSNNNHHHQIIFNSYNNTSNSNLNFLNTNSDSNFTSALSTDELLTQDMMSICENSSAYASSEDTGLGGLSETELIAAHDEDIPLGDTRLLEEHDLANVLSALPDDAFNELFTAVRQDERDEVERALELADKHLKSLQQTIGSGTSESDFLGDFLDVNDEILADTDDICGKMDMASVMHSPETSGIDTSAMFIENSSGGMSTHSTASGTSLSSTSSSSATLLTNSACANNNALTDMRGLVRT